jgi:hypothetical protein
MQFFDFAKSGLAMALPDTNILATAAIHKVVFIIFPKELNCDIVACFPTPTAHLQAPQRPAAGSS